MISARRVAAFEAGVDQGIYAVRLW